MKKIAEYETREELEKDFDDWFGWLITNFDREKGWNNSGNSIEEDFTEDKIEMMLTITEWEFEEDDFKSMNKLNLIYWYCVYLLGKYNYGEYYYRDEVCELLDSIRPF